MRLGHVDAPLDLRAERVKARKLTHNFRGCIIGAPTPRLEEIPIRDSVPQPKVCNLHVPILVEEDVLGLQVSVHNSTMVAVGNTCTSEEMCKQETAAF